jgi:preprotein translocase subunit SecG
MYYFLLTLLILDGLLLAVVVLLQAGQGGGLASLGGGAPEKVLGGRQATTLLHQLSWAFGGGLLVLSLLLSLVASNRVSGLSDVQKQLRTQSQPVPAAPLGGTPAQPPAGQQTPPAAPAKP